MNNVWKIGSRWNKNGSAEASIISIFRRNNVVFLGDKIERFKNEVQIGDYFAVSDGFAIRAVAKVLSNPKLISEFDIRVLPTEERVFDYSEAKSWVYGVKVKIVELQESDYLSYKKQATFCRAYQIRDKVVELYYKDNRKFSIQSHVYTMRESRTSQGLLSNTRYIIPVYQRPYSWGESQIESFIDTIFKGYWGREQRIDCQEPMFIGTMQLSEHKYISDKECEREVIDGQQRISTITIFLKVLSLLYRDNAILKGMDYQWLETRVNNGTQNKLLVDFLNISSLECLLSISSFQNNYVIAAKQIKFLIEESVKPINSHSEVFDAQKFIDYVCSQIFFVVIETCAGISKTIQIFDAINTTGLDLNGGDLFKVRMYEYLRDKKNGDESSFSDINKMYQMIDVKNANYSHAAASIISVLSIYKDFLICKYNLPDLLFDFGAEVFFERVFDTILGINEWQHFEKIVKQDLNFELSLEEIEQCIETVFKWRDHKFISSDGMFAYHLLLQSRYGKYVKIVYLVILKYGYDEKKLDEVLVLLNKLAFIYSVRYGKSLYRIHSFMQASLKSLFRNNYDDFIRGLKNQLLQKCNRKHTEQELSGYITDNTKKKNLIARMTSYLYERNCESNIDKLKNLLFVNRVDIEHIHANADASISVDSVLQNSIGNLTLLEYNINRSISDSVFAEKINKYACSEYSYVRNLAKLGCTWDQEDIRKRRDEIIEKITHYLFS